MPEAPFSGDPPPPEFDGPEFLVENGVPLRVVLDAKETGYYSDFLNNFTGIRIVVTSALDPTLSAESRVKALEPLNDEQYGLASIPTWADYVRARLDSTRYFPNGVPDAETLDQYAEPFSRLPRAGDLESIVQTMRGFAEGLDPSSLESVTALHAQLLENEAQANGIINGRDAEIRFRELYKMNDSELEE